MQNILAWAIIGLTVVSMAGCILAGYWQDKYNTAEMKNLTYKRN